MSTKIITDWQGVALSVAYIPNCFSEGVHHIELKVLCPAGAILPVTDTGYRSHFFTDDPEEFGGLAGYVQDWLDRHAASPEWKRREMEPRQLRLF
jgi:hypothetical protein